MTLLEAPPAVTPVTAAIVGVPAAPGGAGSWKWQLRDKNGRWIQMGSEVSFSLNGKTITGIIVGSPGPGKAIVKLPNGSTVTVPTAGVTATGKTAPKAPSPAGEPDADRKRQAKAVDARLNQPGASGRGRPLTRNERKRRARARARAMRRHEREQSRRDSKTSGGSGNGDSSGGSSSSNGGGSSSGSSGSSGSSTSRGGSSSSDEMTAPDDRRLTGTHRTSQSIESVIRDRAKRQGKGDPFADEKESGGKSKDGGSKDGQGSGSTKGGSSAGSSSGKRKSTKKKLTQSQIDAVAAIFKQVLKHVKAGEYQTALGQLDNAKAILKDTDAPWSLKRIHFLQKGLKGGLGYTASGVRHVRTPGGAQHYGQPIGAVIVADPVTRAIKAALRPGRDGWTKVEKYGLDYDPEFAKNPAVVAARALPEGSWDDVPVQDWKLPLAGGIPLHANEPDLKNKTLAKVHEPGFEFREGYFNEIVIDTEGRAHIVDGHHRVGLHAEAGHDSLPAKVIDVREDTPAAAAVRKAMGISRPLVKPLPESKPSKIISTTDYMALRTLRMGAIRAFGGDSPAKSATEFGMARNRALEALSLAAGKDMRRKDALKKLLDARRQVAAARAWSDLPARQAKLATLEAQITQAVFRLDPEAAAALRPKRLKISAATKVKVAQGIARIPTRAVSAADWTSTILDRLSTAGTLTSAGNSWKWQLRDSKGQWVEMGSKVRWMANGLARSGTIVGSPEPGQAIVQDDDGNRVRLSSNRLTSMDPPAPSGQPVMVSRRERRALQRQERRQQKARTEFKQTPAMAEAMADMADNIRENVDPKNWANAIDATGEVIVGEVAGNLPRRLQLLERVKALKEKGLDAQIRLAVYFQTRESHSRQLARAHFWASEYLGDIGATDNPTPSWSAIPTLVGLPNPASNPVDFLTESGKMITQLLKAASSLVSSAAVIVGAGGDSWRWQLRDKDGQWIDMGSRVSWISKGLLRTGILIGSPKEGTARVREDKTGQEFTMPSATRLTALPEVGNKVRYTTGGKNPKGILAEVVGLPKAGRVTVRDLRTGKEKTIAEKTVKVLPLDRLRAQVKEYGGLSIKIEGAEPKTGFMAAQLKGSKQLTPEEFFGDAGEDALFDFMRENQKQFDSDPDVYLGLWYDEKDNKVVIDVSHNIQDRDTAVLAGRYQDQKSVWDVVNMEEIDTGGTGGYGEAREEVRPTTEEGVGDDGRGVAGLGQAADLGTQAAVDDRKYIRHPPPVGGLRIVDAKSSMAAHDPEAWEFINNDGGTLADPKHLRVNKRPTEGKPPSEMTASMSQMADHFTEVLRAAQAGVPYSDKANPSEMGASPLWYERAHQTCLDLLDKYKDDGNGNGIPGLTIEKVTGVMAAMSPRMQWDMNIAACEKILKAEANPEFRKIPISRAQGNAEFTDILVSLDDAKNMTKAGSTTFVEDSLQILRDQGSPTEIMGGLKRRSFWNSLLDPSNEWDVCIDGWMASATRRIGLTYQDGTPLDKEGLKWLDDGKGQIQMEDSGAGYIITADAVRVAAARVGLTPLQAQAMYWVSVGGGAKGAEMWTDPPSQAYLDWKQAQLTPTQAIQERLRVSRLAEGLKPLDLPRADLSPEGLVKRDAEVRVINARILRSLRAHPTEKVSTDQLKVGDIVQSAGVRYQLTGTRPPGAVNGVTHVFTTRVLNRKQVKNLGYYPVGWLDIPGGQVIQGNRYVKWDREVAA